MNGATRSCVNGSRIHHRRRHWSKWTYAEREPFPRNRRRVSLNKRGRWLAGRQLHAPGQPIGAKPGDKTQVHQQYGCQYKFDACNMSSSPRNLTSVSVVSRYERRDVTLACLARWETAMQVGWRRNEGNRNGFLQEQRYTNERPPVRHSWRPRAPRVHIALAISGAAIHLSPSCLSLDRGSNSWIRDRGRAAITRVCSPYRITLFRATIERRVPSPGHTRASSSPPHSPLSPDLIYPEQLSTRASSHFIIIRREITAISLFR